MYILLFDLITFSTRWKNSTDPEDGHTKNHIIVILFPNHQYMYQKEKMIIPICHYPKAVSLHSDVLRNR